MRTITSRCIARDSTRSARRRSDFHRLDDVRRLPFTLKSDLRDHYPFGLFARPVSALARLHASSGTTGKPTVVGYTQDDLATWAEPDGALDGVRGRAARRRRPQRVRLWPVHRRARRALRRRAAGRGRGADVGRLDRAAGGVDRRFRRARAVRDAVVRAGDRRGRRKAGRRSAQERARSRPLRRRAVERRDAEARSRRAWVFMRSTSTVCPRSWARASPASATARPACTAGRTTSCSR